MTRRYYYEFQVNHGSHSKSGDYPLSADGYRVILIVHYVGQCSLLSNAFPHIKLADVSVWIVSPVIQHIHLWSSCTSLKLHVLSG